MWKAALAARLRMCTGRHSPELLRTHTSSQGAEESEASSHEETPVPPGEEEIARGTKEVRLFQEEGSGNAEGKTNAKVQRQ